jgi:glutathione S-transferase
MTLTLHFHPLASFCHKVLIALYENDTPFTPHVVDLGDATSRAAFEKLWPVAKMPVLVDDAAGRTIPESSIIIEYLAQHHPGPTTLIPADTDLARQMRLRDRFYDQYVHQQMQKIVGDRLRPKGMNDPFGVEDAKRMLTIAYGMVDQEMGAKTWAMGDAFTMADCAAAPALFFANKVFPLGDRHANASAYLKRLTERPSYARVLEEAQPYMHLVPPES